MLWGNVGRVDHDGSAVHGGAQHADGHQEQGTGKGLGMAYKHNTGSTQLAELILKGERT